MNEQNKFQKFTDSVKILLFVGVMLIGFLIGLAFFARPDHSDNEKRDLTEFPKFTISSFLSGDFTSQVSLWYSDTFPLREPMIAASNFLEQTLYGIRDEQFIGGGTGDVIPNNPSGSEVIFNPTDDGKGEKFEGLYVNGDTAYQLYYFHQQNSDSYVALINKFASQVKGKATVYDMIVPLHYQIALPESTRDKHGASDCAAAIEYMYSRLSSNVIPVDTLPNLISHNKEYLYFRTDHHWTARGAYYAFDAFCDAKGITTTPLDSYQRLEFHGFLGTFYEQAKSPGAMRDNPDYIEAFVPIGTNVETVYDANGKVAGEYAVVYKGADKYSAGNKYLCFIAGDQPLTKIENPNVKDGSSIVIIKESYGNAFVPFLVDSYSTVYVIDYRKCDGNLADFVTGNSIDDVLFLNVINNTSTAERLRELSSIID